MKTKWLDVGKVFIVIALGALTLGTQAAWAGSVTFDLVCVLNNTSDPCNPLVPSFGTVTIFDNTSDPGGDLASDQEVGVTVDLLNVGLKFRDLMLNYSGGPDLTGPAGLAIGTYSIAPYTGTFNLGGTGPEGWQGNSGDLFVLSFDGNVVFSDFDNKDSLGNVNVAIHIQSIGPDGCTGSGDGSTDCVPGQTGTGSLKIGGLEGGGPPEEIPEPSTTALLGGGLVALLWAYRRRGQA